MLTKLEFMGATVIIDGDVDAEDLTGQFKVINYIANTAIGFSEIDGVIRNAIPDYAESINPPNHDEVHKIWDAIHGCDTQSTSPIMYNHRHVEVRSVSGSGIKLLMKLIREMRSA